MVSIEENREVEQTIAVEQPEVILTERQMGLLGIAESSSKNGLPDVVSICIIMGSLPPILSDQLMVESLKVSTKRAEEIIKNTESVAWKFNSDNSLRERLRAMFNGSLSGFDFPDMIKSAVSLGLWWSNQRAIELHRMRACKQIVDVIEKNPFLESAPMLESEDQDQQPLDNLPNSSL